jgi:two-component system, OmpR family, sensor histidine kinase KdpD
VTLPPGAPLTRRVVLGWVLGLIGSVAAVGAETAIFSVGAGRRLPDVAMLYLLGVVVMAMRFGYPASLFTAALSVAAFDLFFIEPFYSFDVEDKRYVLTFAIMFAVAFAFSNRTESIKRSEAAAKRREMRTAKLYAMSRELTVAPSSEEIIRAANRHLREAFASDVAILLAGEGGRLAIAPSASDLPIVNASVEAAAADLCARAVKPGAPSSAVVDGGTRLVLLRASTGTVGVLVIRPVYADQFADPTHEGLLATFANQIALAVERGRMADSAQAAQLQVQNERLRNALLSSVSHDLRTPLAVIKGAVTALLEGKETTASRRGEYLSTISDEASRLDRLVRNLLHMTSLEAGALRVHNKEWQSLEEVVGVVLARLEDHLGRHPVQVHIPPDAALAPFDGTLIGQVLVNLIENAAKHTPADTAIEINASKIDHGVQVEVADSGPGVPEGHGEAIFEKFHRVSDTSPGMGIGLTICRGIVTAHGGRIWYERREGGGASFRFVLPRDGESPSMAALPELPGEV